MCILLVAYRSHPDYDLVVAANRDEFYDRPSAFADYWPERPGLLAGRDLTAGGTWLGVDSRGRFAAVTNLRGAGARSATHSRGHLVRDFLSAAETPASYLDQLTPRGPNYAGCNLIISDRAALHWWSQHASQALAPGVYGVSNAPLDEEWPKVARLKSAFSTLRHVTGAALVTALAETLRDHVATPPGADPGSFDLGYLEESIFVRTPTYGTRCSSIVLRAYDGTVTFVERVYDAEGIARHNASFEFSVRA